MIKDNKIDVSLWEKDRYEDYYELTFTTTLNKILLAKEDIIKSSKYKIQTNNSTKFKIVDIKDLGNDNYDFIIRTEGSKPAPGKVTITYPIVTPEWVTASNFEDIGIPADSTTYGISYLINGVSKAFENTSKKNNNYFTINIILE